MILHLDPGPRGIGIEVLPLDADVLDESRWKVPLAHEAGP
jgi:hypothetical protein